MELSELQVAQLMVLSPDRSLLAFLYGNRLTLRKTDSQDTLASWEVPGSVSALELSPDNSMVAALHSKNQLVVWQAKDGQKVASFEDSVNIQEAGWMHGSRTILVVSELGLKATVLDLAGKSLAYLKHPKQTQGKCFALARRFPFVAILEKAQGKDALRIYHTEDFKLVNSIALQGIDSADIRWSPDDSTLLVWDSFLTCRCLAIDPAFGVRGTFQGKASALSFRTGEFSPDSLYFAGGSHDDKVRIFNRLLFKLIAELEVGAGAYSNRRQCQYFLFKEEERRNQKGVSSILVSVDSFKLVPPKPSDKGPLQAGVNSLSFSPESGFLAVKSQSYSSVLWVYDVKKMRLVSAMQLLGPVRQFVWVREGVLAIATGSSRIVFWKGGASFLMDVPLRLAEGTRESKVGFSRLQFDPTSEVLLAGDRNCFLSIKVGDYRFDSELL